MDKKTKVMMKSQEFIRELFGFDNIVGSQEKGLAISNAFIEFMYKCSNMGFDSALLEDFEDKVDSIIGEM
mgnify:CR=1 FL=1